MSLAPCARSDGAAAQLQQEGDLVTFEAIVLEVKRSYVSVVVDVEHADTLDDIGAGAAVRVTRHGSVCFRRVWRRVQKQLYLTLRLCTHSDIAVAHGSDIEQHNDEAGDLSSRGAQRHAAGSCSLARAPRNYWERATGLGSKHMGQVNAQN